MNALALVLALSVSSAAQAAAASPPLMGDALNRQRAMQIAEKGMLENIATLGDGKGGTRRVILAGAHQFHALWVRDFAQSVPGYLRIGQQIAVRDSLDTIFEAQRSDDGLIPRGLDSAKTWERIAWEYLGVTLPFHAPLDPSFETENHVLSIDGNLLVPIAAWEYLSAQDDPERLREWWPHGVAALGWIERNFLVDDLVDHQPPYSDWEDSLARTGRVALTNEQYLLALQVMQKWAHKVGDPSRAAVYEAQYRASLRAFDEFFFDSAKGYLRNFEANETLSADANFTAVAEGLLPDDQATIVMQTMRASPLWGKVPGRATWPNLPSSLKSDFVKSAGMADYHDSLSWIWLGAEAAIADAKLGKTDECEQVLTELSQIIVAFGKVDEVYETSSKKSAVDNLQPVDRFRYQAEGPFTWSSAKYIEAATRGCGLRQARGISNTEGRVA